MEYTSQSRALGKAERSTAYKLARQMGNPYAVLALMNDGCNKRQGLTLSNGI